LEGEVESYEQLARSAYQAALAERKRQGPTFTAYGCWNTLTPHQQAIWIAAVKQVAADIAALH
jgi:hypothetical protein